MVHKFQGRGISEHTFIQLKVYMMGGNIQANFVDHLICPCKYIGQDYPLQQRVWKCFLVIFFILSPSYLPKERKSKRYYPPLFVLFAAILIPKLNTVCNGDVRRLTLRKKLLYFRVAVMITITSAIS